MNDRISVKKIAYKVNTTYLGTRKKVLVSSIPKSMDIAFIPEGQNE